MPLPALIEIPPGPWAVGVSGGVDSITLLALLRDRSDLQLHIAHLDHEMRGEASTGDAEFVEELCRRWNLPCTIARRSDFEPTIADLPANSSARYRALRHHLFRRVCTTHRLQGVLLAHHADDQAETVLQRLLRSASPSGMAGMQSRTRVAGLTIVRPLLGVGRAELRALLATLDQAWREDASNASPAYQRNRVRRVLDADPTLGAIFRDLGRAMAELADWTSEAAPALAESFPVRALADLPEVVAICAARRWLAARGVPRDGLSPAVVSRLLIMARDAATPARGQFPGQLLVTRRRGQISAAAR